MHDSLRVGPLRCRRRQQAFGLKPDLVTGPATNTTAAIDLVQKLTGVPAINIIDPDAEASFRDFIGSALSVKLQ